MSSMNFRKIVRALAVVAGREGYSLDTYALLNLGAEVETILPDLEPVNTLRGHDALVSYAYNNDAILDLIFDGKKIDAIKTLRNIQDRPSLLEAKNAIEAVMALPVVSIAKAKIDKAGKLPDRARTILAESEHRSYQTRIASLQDTADRLVEDKRDIQAQLDNFYKGSCPHGLSRDLCDGPGHYPPDRDDLPF